MTQTRIRSDGTLIAVRDGGCYKTAYPHRRDAVKAAKRIAGVMFIYECRRCGSHHLTRQPTGGRGY